MARVSSIRSGPSRKACYLRFINRTSRRVNVIWVDYAGCSRNYGTLDPARHFDIHTYEGHPWISEDSVSKKRMLLNKSETFYPSSSSDRVTTNRESRCYLPILTDNELSRNRDGGVKRQHVHITLPVFPLFERSAEVIIKHVHNKDDIQSLRLPKRLKTELTSSYFSC